MPLPDVSREEPAGGMEDMDMGGDDGEPADVYSCTAHPGPAQKEPGYCPKCGMTLIPRNSGVASVPGKGGDADAASLEGGMMQ